MSDKLKIYLDGNQVETTEDTVVTISYKLEDNSDFQSKQSSSALNITLPATLLNDKLSNTFHQPSIADLTTGEAFKSARKAVIEASGYEVLVGKAFLSEATHTDIPEDYTYDFYGDNADYMVDLQDTTLFDLLKAIQFPFTKNEIIASWQYDGTNKAKPYVFAPVRYGEAMADYVVTPTDPQSPVITDGNMLPEYMKPAISVYWILYFGFQSVGYKVSSVFFDTPYFRRLTMPWTWGNFLYSDGTQTDNLRFLAKSANGSAYFEGDFGSIIDLNVSNDSINGAYDTNGSYEYDDTTKQMKWTYLPDFDYSNLQAFFHFQIQYDYVSTDNGTVELRIQWFKNGQRITTGKPFENGNGDRVFDYNAPGVGGNRDTKIIDVRQSFDVVAGDVITAQFYGHIHDTGLGTNHFSAEVITYEIEYFRVPLGATIYFSNYLAFKKHKFLDMFAGIVDCFNLIPKADTVSKVVTIEPQHAYSLTSNGAATIPGYFNFDFVDWNEKQDVSVKSTMTLFRDYNRELIYKFKDDSSDGILKLIQDRNANIAGAAKYVLPDRFTNDKTEVENRFFSPVMHYNVQQWKNLSPSGDAPQMICMIPENISNTSHDEAQNTFNPKLAYYKGLITGYGWVFDGSVMTNYPFMFAVNYKPGGVNDPILSYCDEAIAYKKNFLAGEDGTLILGEDGQPIPVDDGINTDFVVGKGFLRRFFLQRMAIMRNGQYYSTSFRLKNIDVANPLHREHIICKDERWELTKIKDYNPVADDSTVCELRKWSPVTQKDSDAVFPSAGEIIGNASSVSTYDMKYFSLLALSSDVKVPSVR